MDDIDTAKLGKKDEKLVGWDHLRKPKLPDSNLQPMKAKNTLLTPNAIRVSQPLKNSQHKQGSGFVWYIVLVLVIGMIVTKLLGYW